MARFVAPEQLASSLGELPDEPRVVTSGSFATPLPLLALLDAVLPTWRLFAVNALPGLPAREGITYESAFVGAGMRGYPRLEYYPCRLSLVPSLFEGPLPPDIVAVQVSRPIDGRVSLGIEVQILPGAIAAARARGALVIAQLNPQMPFVHGDGVLDLDWIDLVVEIEAPLPASSSGGVDDESAAIGERVAAMVPQGATIQAGIGAVPDAVLHGLRNHRGLRIWTELLTDGFHGLYEAGALDDRFPVTGSFAFGSREFYAWMDDNPQVQLLACDYTNDPAIISSQPQMVSINTALQVDLFGSANASRIRNQIFSGFGGQTDFFIGALHSPGGMAIMALKSWHPKAGVSTIVGKLDQPTTSTQFSYAVTENGSARIFGASQRQQALGLIEAADPRARDDLREAARSYGLI